MRFSTGFLPAALVMICAFTQDKPQPQGQDTPPQDPNQKPKVYQPLTKDEEERFNKEKEKFSVKPVTTEPDLPSFQEAKTLKDYRELPGGGYQQIQDKKITRLVLPATIGITSGMIEVFATLGPKDHEAVLRVTCNIHLVDLTLSSYMGMKRGDYPEKYGEEDKNDDSRLLIFVQWKDKDGKAITYRAEDLLIHVKRDSTFPRIGWVYLGQWHESEHPVTKKPMKTLRAALSKLMVTNMRDPYSLIDNALKADDADNNEHAANMFVLPESGTEVKLILRKPTPEELKGIKEIEKGLYPK
jgi:hypothetical protein